MGMRSFGIGPCDQASPDSRIPVKAEVLRPALRSAYVLNLPWKLCVEVTTQLAYIREWAGRFVTAAPGLGIS
jgi:hypothetical protein